MSGYIWTVYPRRSADPMVSVGMSDDLDAARAAVERELATVDNSAFGVVITPDGMHDVCRRAVEGFHWAPLFADADRP